MKNAIEQIRPQSRNVIDFIEKHLGEEEMNDAVTSGCFDNRKDAVIALVANKGNDIAMTETLCTLNIDLWFILSANPEGEAEEKLTLLYMYRNT